MSLAKSKDLRAKRAKLIDDARALAGADAPSAEDNAKFEAMMAEADGLKAQIDRIERADSAEKAELERLRGAGAAQGLSPDELRDRTSREEEVFRSYLRRGAEGIRGDDREVFDRAFSPQNGAGAGGWTLRPRAAQATTSGAEGGYTIPQGFYGRLIDAQLEYGGMLNEAFVFDTESGNALPVPTDNDTSNVGAILGENTQVGTQDVTFGAVTLNAYNYTSQLVLVSRQLLQDSYFDLDAFLSQKLGVRIARILNNHFTVGTGTGQPTGVIGSGANSAVLGYTCGGATNSGETTTVVTDDLIELEHSVDPSYRNGAVFMMHDTTLKVIKKLKDTLGRPLWLPGIAVKEPDTINGYRYRINQSMPVPGASNKIMAFGDFKNYFIRRVAGVTVLRLTERYADFNQVGFVAFQRWDGQMIDAGTHPIKYLQNSAT